MVDIWADMQNIAEALHVTESGRAIIGGLKKRVVNVIERACMVRKRPTVVCVEWFDPLMVGGNWVPEMVELAGGRDLLGAPGQHSAWMEWPKLAQADPDVIVLMPCGFSLDRTRREMAALEKRPEWRKLRAVKSKHVYLTDGNHYFNRPGPRVVESIEILAEILQPKMFGLGHEDKGWARS
jgi:iron complex transport system substrate-binding protein